jgi:hypothetical protein
MCAERAPSGAQDCNPPPVNPSGAFCCRDLQEGGGSNVSDGSAGDAATETDAPSCSIVLASNHDRSCTVDTDCLAVGEVPSCPAGGCDGCTTEAINNSAIAQYMTAFAQAFASRAGGVAIALAKAAQSAVGQVPGGLLRAASHRYAGPPDACAYADEFCCLR